MLTHIRARALLLAAIVASGSAAPVAQQGTAPGALDDQIGRIFDSPEYQVPRFGPLSSP